MTGRRRPGEDGASGRDASRRSDGSTDDDASGAATSAAGSDPAPWQIVLGIEAVLLLIALVMPITPTKTGSRWSPAELVVDGPTYFHEVLAHLVLGNVIVGILALIVLVTTWWQRARRGPRER